MNILIRTFFVKTLNLKAQVSYYCYFYTLGQQKVKFVEPNQFIIVTKSTEIYIYYADNFVFCGKD